VIYSEDKLGSHMKSNIKIKFLTECEEHIPSLATLWFEEISRHWVPDVSIGKEMNDLERI